MTDVHSHLLPGVDDGIQTFEEAEEAVRFLEQLGVRHMLLTPHVMEDYASNTANTLTERFAEFQRRVASSIHFTLAAEYMLDAAFQKHRSEELLLLGNRRILVETSYMAGPPDLPDILYDLSVSGYAPVIAHPERYPTFHRHPQLVSELADMGALFQITADSLTGRLGEPIRDFALQMLLDGTADVLATDAHHPVRRPNTLDDMIPLFPATLPAALVTHATLTAPAKILQNRAPEEVRRRA